MRVGLVGCVKSKRAASSPAKDLYTSPLFAGRRPFVERSCDRWFILSAEHGLVHPETVLAPYDRSLVAASVESRRRWSADVLGQLKAAVGDLRGTTFEVHAGKAYGDFGLIAGLKEAEARVDLPVDGLSLGQQLAFYKRSR